MKKTLAFIMAILTTFTALSFGACNGADVHNSSAGKKPPKIEYPSYVGGFEQSDSVENGISLLTTRIEKSDYASYGISEQAESAIEITATVTPADATNPKLDWSVSFAKTDDTKYEEWSTGKNVSDYVTVTPASDGGTSAVVSNFQAFGAPIDITVTSRDNSEVTATLPCHYEQRLTGISLNVEEDFLPVGNIIYDQMTASYSNVKQSIELSSAVYTLPDEGIRVGCRVFVTEEWKNAIEAEGLELNQNAEKRNVYYVLETYYLGTYGIEMLETKTDVERQIYKNAMKKLGAGTKIGMVYFFAESIRNNEGLEFDLVLGEDFYVPVENVSFTDTQLKF